MQRVELAKIKETLSHTDGNQQLTWLAGTHLTLVFSGMMFALMDRISAGIQPVKG
jgi:uncharacterized membrane protein YqhA